MNVAEVLRAVATLSWLVALAVIVVAVMRASRGAAGLRGGWGTSKFRSWFATTERFFQNS